MNRSSLAAYSAAVLLALSASTMLGLQGPGEGKDAKSHERGDPNAESRNPDPKILRERLVMRIEDCKRLQERLQSAVDRIDKGESVELPQSDREHMRPPRPGENRGEHPDAANDKGGKMPPEPLSDEERNKLLVFVREQMPRAAEHLNSTSDPEISDRVLKRFAPKIREVMNLKASDPKLYTFRVEEMRAGFDVFSGARDLTEAVRAKKPEAETAVFEATIKDAIGRRFDAQLAAQRLELESLGERVDHLKAEIDRKSANRNTSVNEEAVKLIGRARNFDPAMEDRFRRGRRPEDGKSDQPRGPEKGPGSR